MTPRAILLVVAALASSRPVLADEPPAAPATGAIPSAAATDAPSVPDKLERPESDIERRLRLLEEQNVRLVEEVGELRAAQGRLKDNLRKLSSKVVGRVGGYMDFGLFYVAGNGSGIRPDTGHMYLPQYASVPDSWVFMGDPLSTAINSRGEPPDTADSRALTFDAIHNGGKLSFITNALNINLFAGIGDSLTFNALVDLVPRGRDVSVDGKDGVSKNPSALGDFIDVKLAYAEYRVPTDRVDLRLTVGKFDSVLGIEYRWQESPDRLTVTPSLICRYTCGRPLGVKARLRVGDDVFVLNLAVTNGTHQTEYFPFYNEIDTNFFKTVAARLSTKIPVGAGIEIGASGAFGGQDNQSSDSVYQWHYGFDLHVEIRDFDLRAEFVQGRAPGKDEEGAPAGTCGAAPCLTYRGAYGQVAYRVLNWLLPYVRADWRDAVHRSGDSFVYVADLVRITGGLRFDIGSNVIFKAEYTRNMELGPLPQFPNDSATSSLVFRY